MLIQSADILKQIRNSPCDLAVLRWIVIFRFPASIALDRLMSSESKRAVNLSHVSTPD